MLLQYLVDEWKLPTQNSEEPKKYAKRGESGKKVLKVGKKVIEGRKK